jgi:vesicle-associated membrane protein 7
VKDAMLCNIDRVLQRGERIDLLVEKVSVMADAGIKFERRNGGGGAERRKKHSQHRNLRIGAVLCVFVCAVGYVGLTLGCGGLSLAKCVP